MTQFEFATTQRNRISFNLDWLFCRGDGPGDSSCLTYASLRSALLPTANYLLGADSLQRRASEVADVAIATPTYATPEFPDTEWARVSAPHDHAIFGPFSIDLPGETGKLPWQGVAWYRKHFHVASLRSDERLVLEIDGAMSFSSIWLNGVLIGGWPYGYTSFQLDLTNYLAADGNNVIAIRLDNPENSSRWYPGAGLYRNVWLTRKHAVHIAPHELFVHTPRVTSDAAVINVDLVLRNQLEVDVLASITTSLSERDPITGNSTPVVAVLEDLRCDIPRQGYAQQTVCTTLKNPKRWSLAERNRYFITCRVSLDGIEVDQVTVPFGIRSITMDADKGFLINGEHTPLKGVCLHHDLGALGTAVSVRAMTRQIEVLQSMGCNSIRTSHNPPAPELLELCDEMGMLLMVEAFDCWRRGKKHPPGVNEGEPGFRYFDYASVFDEWHEPDLRAMIRLSRNHPSVIIYSIGNEVVEQWHADGWAIATQLAGITREEDRTRPITSGCNGEIAAYRGFQTALDVFGFNYKPHSYPKLHRRNPTLAIVATETASTVSTRGEYFFPVSADKAHGQVDFQVSSYDLSTPPWACLADEEFRGLDEAPYVAGEYVWTGFDYLGEPTPYNSDSTNLLNYSDPAEKEKHRAELEHLGKIQVPSRSSYFGIVDLAGFPKDRFYLYQARWREELPMAHILPHWTWPERIGEITPVHVYSSADEAELFLNGISQGIRLRSKLEYRFRWDEVVYEPGELRVVTKKSGKPWAEAVRRTSGAASRLALDVDRKNITADGVDLAYVTVRVEDAAGELVPRSRAIVCCKVEGPATLLATDNGDPTSLVSFHATERAVHQGLLLIIVRSLPEKPGTISVSAAASGLETATVTFQSK